ncbi:MAG: T9SS type A sorting domain-containing protein [Bacteroidia bacterium]
MKKIYLLSIVLTIAVSFPTTAQHKLAATASEHEAAPAVYVPNKNGSNLPSPQALWDVKFNYNATAALGTGGSAGVAYTGTEFWVSKWASDSLYTLSPAGVLTSAFTIPGVTGVRAFTWDGQFLYAGKASSTISIIDPVTKTQTGTIAISGGLVARHITYDSTANAGAGGFWIGDFGTPITQIDMSGNVLNSISAAAHGMSGMYGSAIDHWTAGAPYLWVFYQGAGQGTPQRIRRIQLPSGSPTGVDYNVLGDVGLNVTNSLAGGLFITNQLDTIRTIVGLLQGDPNRLFGYELNDYVLPAFDASLDTLRSNVPYYQIPLAHVLPMNFTGAVRNAGANNMSGTLNIDVQNSGGSVFNSSPAFSNMASGSVANVTSIGLYTPTTKGVYNVTGAVSVANDASALNDTIKFTFMVTDTVFARETENTASSSLGIGTGTGGVLGQRFTTSINDIATTISFYLNSPTLGDTVSAALYSFTTLPVTSLAITPQYIIQSSDTNGAWITLPFTTGNLNLPAGNYFAGVKEYSTNVTLGTTSSNYRPGAAWVNIAPAATWNTNESYGFPRTYLLRLNVLGINTGINNLNDSGMIRIYPNPTNGKINIHSEKLINKISVSNIMGSSVYDNTFSTAINSIDISHLNQGVYFIKLEGTDFITTQKIIVEN